MFVQIKWLTFLLFLLGRNFIFLATAQKNNLGISVQVLTKGIKTDLETNEDYDLRFKYRISDVVLYGLDYERNWGKIFCSASINFSTMDFKYDWTSGSGFGDGGPDGASQGSGTNTEEKFYGKFNFIGLNLILGTRAFILDNAAFRFYLYFGLGVDYPIYIGCFSQFRVTKTSSLYIPNYSTNNRTYNDTTFYSNENVSFRTGLGTCFPLGIRYRFNLLKNFCFDINMGIRPQVNGFSINQNFKITNGFNFGGTLMVPIGKRKE